MTSQSDLCNTKLRSIIHLMTENEDLQTSSAAQRDYGQPAFLKEVNRESKQISAHDQYRGTKFGMIICRKSGESLIALT